MSNTKPSSTPIQAAKIPFTSKLLRASMLDSSLYEAVEHDPNAIRDAVFAVVLVNILSGLGIGLNLAFSGGSSLQTISLPLIVGTQVIFALLNWFVLTAIIFFVGVLILRGTAGFREVQRTIAFAYTPIAFQVLLALTATGSRINPLTILILLITYFWLIFALIVAVRQSLDVGTGKAVGIVVIAAIIFMAVQTLIVQRS